MPHSPAWTILIPCHKKGPYVRSTFENATKVFRNSSDVRLIFIENASNDGTVEILASLQSTIPGHHLVKLELPTPGLGQAVRATLPYLQDRTGWLILHAGDAPFGSTDLQAYQNAVTADPTPRVLVGSKLHPQSKVQRPPHRWLLTYLSYLARTLFFRTRVRDTQGTFCMPVAMFRDLAPKTRTPGFFFNSEVILTAEAQGSKVQEVPVTMLPRQSTTSVRYLRDGFVFLYDMLRFRRRLSYPAKPRRRSIVGTTLAATAAWALWLLLMGRDHFQSFFSGLETQALTDGFKMVYWSYFEFQKVHLHPPITAVLLFVWGWFNSSEVWIRFFPALCGWSTLLLVAARFQLRYPTWVAILGTFYLSWTAGFYDLHATLLNYGWSLCIGAGLLLVYDLYRRQKQTWVLAGFLLLTYLSAFSDYASVLLLLPLWASLLSVAWRRARPRAWKVARFFAYWMVPLLLWVGVHYSRVQSDAVEYLKTLTLFTVDGGDRFTQGNTILLMALFPKGTTWEWALVLTGLALLGLLVAPRPSLRHSSLLLFLQSYALTLAACFLVRYPWITVRHRYAVWILGIFVLVQGWIELGRVLHKRFSWAGSRSASRLSPRATATSALVLASVLTLLHLPDSPASHADPRTAQGFRDWSRQWNQAVDESEVLFTDLSTMERVHWYAVRNPALRLRNVIQGAGMRWPSNTATTDHRSYWSLYQNANCEILKNWVHRQSGKRWAAAALKNDAQDPDGWLACVQSDPQLSQARRWITTAGFTLQSGVTR